MNSDKKNPTLSKSDQASLVSTGDRESVSSSQEESGKNSIAFSNESIGAEVSCVEEEEK